MTVLSANPMEATFFLPSRLREGPGEGLSSGAVRAGEPTSPSRKREGRR